MTHFCKRALQQTVTQELFKEWRRTMSKEVTPALATCLQELRLPAVRAQYEAVAQQASAETWSYPEYLLELLQRECQQRQHKRIERLLKESRLPLEKNWASLDLKRLPGQADAVPAVPDCLLRENIEKR